MSEGDRAIVREIAFEAANQVSERLLNLFEERLKRHAAECPVKIEVEAKINQAKGARWVIGLVVAIVGFLAGSGGAILGTVLKHSP